VPKGWTKTSLENCVEVLDGLRVPVNSQERAKRLGGVPYYGATGQVGWIDQPIFDETLVLLGEDGAPFFDKTRHVAYVVRGKSWVNNHAHVLRASRGISAPLLAHQLNVIDYRGFVTGTTRWKLSQGPMRKIELAIPPEGEQQRIADTLDELLSDLDAGVAALERVRAKLKHYRAAVLKAAVEGTLTAQWRREHPATETADALLTRILAERRRLWEEAQLAKFAAAGKTPPKNWKAKYVEPVPPDTTTLPMLPQEWCWVSVEQSSDFIQYGTSAKTTSEAHGVPVLRMGNIRSDGTLDSGNLKFLPVDHAEFPALLLAPGDLIFNRTNSAELVGKTACYEGRPSPCSFASYLIRLRILGGVQPKLVAHAINSGHGRRWIKSVVTQMVGQANVNGSKLAGFCFPLPPEDEQHAIVEAVEAQLSVIDHLERDLDARLKSAQSLRQSILRHAFTGQLVPQDPNDEPASELLKRIAAEREERARLAALAKRKAKPARAGRARDSGRARTDARE